MAPRKTYRSVKVINKDYSNLVLNDVLCPICRNILIEPVSLPCNHGFCFSCFEGTVANANLTCPLCRVRFGSWHRVATKENKIINEPLWLAIKKTFSQLVQNRLSGIDDNLIEESPIRLSTPGDIRKEYEEQRRKELLEIERQRVVEAKASEELILKLKDQEKQEREKREQALRNDEEIARQLAEELNQKVAKMQLVTPKKSKPLDKFLVDLQKATTSEQKVAKAVVQKKSASKDNNKLPLYFLSKPGDHSEKVHAKNGATNKDTKLEVQHKTFTLAPCYFFLPVDVQKACSHGKLLKIPATYSKTNLIIGTPKGKTDFTHSTVSAFVTIHKAPLVEYSSTEKSANTAVCKKGVGRKRKLFQDNAALEDASKAPINGLKKSPRKTENSPAKAAANVRKSTRLLSRTASDTKDRSEDGAESPPFYGFESSGVMVVEDCDLGLSNNNIVVKNGNDKMKRSMQEKSDLEFARKLQQEFNKSARYSTRSSINGPESCCKKQRQIKIDEIIKCRGKVK